MNLKEIPADTDCVARRIALQSTVAVVSQTSSSFEAIRALWESEDRFLRLMKSSKDYARHLLDATEFA